MNQLLKAMGIQKGSFYNAFGSKHEVYLRTLDQYTQLRLGELRELTSGKPALEALRAHFDALYEDCISPQGHRGCMLLNCALETAYQDRQAQALVKKGLALHEKILHDLIVDGQKTGEIDRELDVGATAKTMMALVMGMRVYSRSGSDPQAVRTLADQAIRLVAPKDDRLVAPKDDRLVAPKDDRLVRSEGRPVLSLRRTTVLRTERKPVHRASIPTIPNHKPTTRRLEPTVSS